jgi:hypothetical protein
MVRQAHHERTSTGFSRSRDFRGNAYRHLNTRSMHSHAIKHRNESKSIHGSTSSPRTDFDRLTTNGLR